MTTSVDQRAIDTETLRRLIAERSPAPVGLGELREAIGPPRERFDAALRAIRALNLVTDDAFSGGGLMLSEHGRMLESRAALTGGTTAPIAFGELREAYVRSLPAYRSSLRKQAEEQRAARWAEEQRQERLLLQFISPTMLGPGWRVGPEPDPAATSLIALHPPAFADLPDSTVYIRVRFDLEQRAVWLQASNGGPVVGLAEGWPPDQVRAAVLRAYVPAVDPSAPPLPTLADLSTAGDTASGHAADADNVAVAALINRMTQRSERS